jgi:hypothetical protein
MPVLLSLSLSLQGLHYNPYFPGGAIAMPKMLVDGGVEYEDGARSLSRALANMARARTRSHVLPTPVTLSLPPRHARD